MLLALIVIHLGAALWHHFVRRDRVTARMIDGGPERYDLERLQIGSEPFASSRHGFRQRMPSLDIASHH